MLAFDLEDLEEKKALMEMLFKQYRALAIGRPVDIVANTIKSVFGEYFCIHMNFITNHVTIDEATETFNKTNFLVFGSILTKLMRQEGFKLSSVSQRSIEGLGQKSRIIYTFEEVLF